MRRGLKPVGDHCDGAAHPVAVQSGGGASLVGGKCESIGKCESFAKGAKLSSMVMCEGAESYGAFMQREESAMGVCLVQSWTCYHMGGGL